MSVIADYRAGLESWMEKWVFDGVEGFVIASVWSIWQAKNQKVDEGFESGVGWRDEEKMQQWIKLNELEDRWCKFGQKFFKNGDWGSEELMCGIVLSYEAVR